MTESNLHDITSSQRHSHPEYDLFIGKVRMMHPVNAYELLEGTLFDLLEGGIVIQTSFATTIFMNINNNNIIAKFICECVYETL